MTHPVQSTNAEATPITSLGPAERKKLADAFELWRRRLLDLSKRNRAINYKPQRVATLTVVDERPAEVFRQLIEDAASFSFRAVHGAAPSTTPAEAGASAATADVPGEPQLDLMGPADAGAASPTEVPSFVPYASGDLAPHHRDTVLQCRGTADTLDLSLRRLAEIQRSSVEEQGVNTLYITLGMLHFTEAPQSETLLRAPLVLVPVTLSRTSVKAGYRLSLGDDEPMVNPSLIEYLRRIHEVRLPPFPEISEDGEARVDLQQFFRAVQDVVEPFARWKVTEEMAVTPLAFAKLVMYRDLEANEDELVKHALLQKLVLRQDAPEVGLPDSVADMELDVDFPPERTLTVVDADSSQLRAIAAVEQGYDLVVHGPPGTGKSQTITNLIAQAIGAGKSVLFVSEKTAALEVVARRLKEVGLSSFCLELHSVKSNKAEALASLRAALEDINAGATATPTVSTLLPKSRERLNAYVRALHARRTATDASVYEMAGRLARSYSAPRIPYPGDPCAVAGEQLDDLLSRCRRADAAGAEVGEVARHGWRDCRRTALSADELDGVAEVAAELTANAAHFRALATAIADATGVRAPGQPREVPGTTELAGLIARSPAWPEGLLASPDGRAVAVELEARVQEAVRVSATGEALGRRYHLDRIVLPDPDDLAHVMERGAGVFGGLKMLLDGRCRLLKKAWVSYLREGQKVGLLELANDLKRVRGWREAVTRVRGDALATAWFGDEWLGADSDLGDLQRRTTWLLEFYGRQHEFHDQARALEAAGRGGWPGDELGQLRTVAERIESASAELMASLKWPAGYLSEEVDQLAARVTELEHDIRRGPTWVAFANATLGLADTPAVRVGTAVFEGQVPSTAVAAVFERSFAFEWLKRTVPEVPELREFSAATHEATRAEFQKLDEQVFVEHRARLRETVRGFVQSRYRGAPTPHQQFLSREMAKQKRHRPLRVTMRDAHEAIRGLKPCFMMSPLSVAQFLPANASFDLVVFDEASQLPTEDAVGAIARGAQLVVVGDPKQLPPTNFFSVQAGTVSAEQDEDGNAVLEETESVLEECLSAGLHQQHLQWHYRSAHERLIQFSNELFYGDSLLVYPAAAYDGPDLGVKFEYLADGVYEGAGLNLVEARRVAEAVVDHFRTTPALSLGVGTFNTRQQNAILDELERLRRDDASLEEFFARERSEPFFVKNLENIQGDERDVILLSVTYGRARDGKLRHNFGPLNRDNGGRRLNVLASRARKKMRIFSSIRAGDIDPNATATRGPALLRDFLLFAETGRIQHHSTRLGETESPFEAHVLEALVEAGYLVDPQVGVGKYRIDLGVRHAERPGVYLAGVECDGAAYHSAPCARDRDRLRQAVLVDRGWTIIRIWSTDWFKDRSGTLERVLLSLEGLKASAGDEDRERPAREADARAERSHGPP